MNPHRKRFLPRGMGWWVDPRITHVTVANLHAYLTSRGWKVKRQPRAELLIFVKQVVEGEEVVAVPTAEDFSDFVQRVIEAITSLAAREERYAVEVLDDILRQPPPFSGNGEEAATSNKAVVP